MIRVLLGSALPILGFGLAAAFVGPSLVATSGSEPILVAGSSGAALHPASFGKADCAPWLHFGNGANPTGTGSTHRVVALLPDFSQVDSGFLLAEVLPGHSAEGAVALLLVDESGRVIAALDPAALNENRHTAGCAHSAATPKPVGPI